MNLKKLKGWLRRIATAEDQGKTRTQSDDASGQSSREAADRPPYPRRTPAHHPGASGKAAPPFAKHANPQAPNPKARSRPLTRQGIPILNPDEDIAQHFLGRADAQDGEAPEKTSGPDRPDQKVGRGPDVQRNAAEKRRKATHRNRAGIRQLDGKSDLHAYFLPKVSKETKPLDRPSTKAAASCKRKTSPSPKIATVTDRHGIPRLDDQTDLRQFFETALEGDEDTAADRDLGEVFRASLDHDARRLMKKKTGDFFTPRRLSLKEKLRRYPVPQAQLDLHGDTALIARQRADSFLQTAGAAGTLTVRIIVGKGLHSEDGAVLPDVIEDLLAALKRDGRVLTFRWDKNLKRKSGAVIVYLEPPL